MAPSIYIVLETAIGLRQQLQCHGQVALGRVQIDVAKIGGKGRKEGLHVGTCPIPFRQPVDSKGVPQVMEPRLMRTRVVAANAGKAAQPPKGEVCQAVAERLMLPRLEKRPVVLIPSSRRG
jgi:hypothetical protein